MPEIIEVRRYAEFIKRRMKNLVIDEIKILNGRYKKHKPFKGYYSIIKKLPTRILKVETKGKFMNIIFDNGFMMLVSLGLSGGWCFKKDSLTKFPTILKYVNKKRIKMYRDKAKNHLNIQFHTKEGSLYYFDMLSYGSISVTNNYQSVLKKLKKLGPDVMDDSTTFEIFYDRITKKSNLEKPIGNAIMNQQTISGIGNYLRADILWMSKVNPFKLVKKLTEKEIKKIYNNTKILTWGSYNKKKALSKNIIDNTTKLPDNYNRDFFVYREEKDINNHKVHKDVLFEGTQKRFIYWVPTIQK